ncbi:heme/hemin ABC transporter substrate-binding protein [Paramicrobacterium chengjingii]|uniref:heme/hemin ABC transporter substrate-binding protein n=1 Tax=Paramicrobacterium chengjingii TaxID=2769067 RepID=UPI00141F846E|nr:ABC transporter substrate-binding protein [Microbacterium chengjingii]
MRRPLVLTAIAAMATFLMVGCSAPASEADPTPEPTSSAAPGSPDAVNALDLTGPVSTETVPDMEPVVTDAEPSFPATVTDATGTEITVASGDRVLALDLYGTLTDTVIGLGLKDRLVGRSNSDTQKALADLPVVTKDGHDLNVEAVLNLDPDLVLTNTTIGSADNYTKLEDVGVTVVRYEQVPSIDDIAGAITEVGDTFGMPDAATELAEHTADELDTAQKTIDALRAETPRAPRAAVLYVRGTAGIFFILGEDYGASDVLAALGLDDVAKNNGITDLKPANAESLVTLDPEIILAMKHGVESSGGVEGFLQRPGMAETTAGTNERIIMAPDSQLLSYGPRTPQALLALARAIYTEAA